MIHLPIAQMESMKRHEHRLQQLKHNQENIQKMMSRCLIVSDGLLESTEQKHHGAEH